ncbi:MAG: PDZ domain-containing protein [Candidatus Coatesbacteria bacterium]|nr:PDZ domain-containing protein [Candidatus Coatesbacteria bacterium]
MRKRILSLIILVFVLTTVSAQEGPDGLAVLRALQDAFARVAAEASRSVVFIEVTSRLEESEEFFFEFWGWEGPEEQRGAGSGFIIDPEGYIMTNAHVVADAETIRVTLADERVYEAELVGADIDSDVALIRLTTEEELALPAARLGDSDGIRVGDWVLAIGSPFGLQHSVTQGIISATGRQNLGLANYEDFIQTDASINPGNSGGPLVNLDGEVIGINSAIRAGGGYGEQHNIGVGFAIPINMAERIARDLREQGRVSRGWLGVSIQDVTEEIRDALELEERRGALVSEIFPGSPADEAGFEVGDVILAVEDYRVDDANDLKNRVARLEVGGEYDFTINREGAERTLEVALGERPADLQAYYRELESAEPESLSLDNVGMEVQTVTDELAEELGLEEAVGALVVRVERDGPADTAGIRRGDVVLEYDRQAIDDAGELEFLTRRTAEGEPVLVLIWRNGRTSFLALEP